MSSSATAPEPRMAFFSSSPYRVHNEARLQHLASLGLPIGGSVLEVGAGPGDHTSFYLERNCAVVATDAREECVQELKKRYPQIQTLPVDMNHPEPLLELGQFDIVHCYGLIYHLENPEVAIAAMSRVCRGMLLIETCVSPDAGHSINPVNEVLGDYTQSTTGHACRPTRLWVFDTLKRYFPFVYQTRTQPIHPEFPTDWSAIPSDHGLVRIVLVASQRQCDLPVLSPALLDQQERPAHATLAEVDIRDIALEDMRRSLETMQVQLKRANEQAVLLESVAAERLALLEAAQRRIEKVQDQSFLGYLMRKRWRAKQRGGQTAG